MSLLLLRAKKPRLALLLLLLLLLRPSGQGLFSDAALVLSRVPALAECQRE